MLLRNRNLLTRELASYLAMMVASFLPGTAVACRMHKLFRACRVLLRGLMVGTRSGHASPNLHVMRIVQGSWLLIATVASLTAGLTAMSQRPATAEPHFSGPALCATTPTRETLARCCSLQTDTSQRRAFQTAAKSASNVRRAPGWKQALRLQVFRARTPRPPSDQAGLLPWESYGL